MFRALLRFTFQFGDGINNTYLRWREVIGEEVGDHHVVGLAGSTEWALGWVHGGQVTLVRRAWIELNMHNKKKRPSGNDLCD